MNNEQDSYYSDMTRISNSEIGWFLKKGPKYLHDMLTGKADGDKGPQLARGTMIHEYLLQPEQFSKDYVVWDKPKPSSDKQEKFVQELINSTEIEPNKAIIEAYKKCYSIVGKTDDKMLSEGLKIASMLKDYIEFKKTDNRIMITQWQSNQLMKIAENIQKHKLASKLLKNEYVSQEDELHHEFHINWEYTFKNASIFIGSDDVYDLTIDCKSLLDSVHFDFKNHICTLMDLKTTVHVYGFEESMKQYDYLRQLCYYKMALMWYLERNLNENIKDWSFKYYIIGIDTNTTEIRVFEFENIDVMSRYKTIVSSLFQIKWHQETGKWDYYKSYYDGDGAEKLKIC